MKRSAALVLIGLLLATAARADDAANPVAASTAPWVDDLALIDQTKADVQAQGVMAVEKYRQRLEDALAGAKHSIELAQSGTDTAYVLTDGATDTLMQMATAAASKTSKAKHVVAVQNPYPEIAFYLGSYYDEIGNPEQALRVLDAGIASLGSMALFVGTSDHRPGLVVERGAALNSLHRSADALANFDEGLKLDGVSDFMRATMYRGRGFALTELGKLDEAEASYNESLKFAPGNAHAEQELRYIAGLRAGKQPTKTYLESVKPREDTTPATGSGTTSQ